MRVRTGRFEELRSGETGFSQLVRPSQGQDGVEKHAAVAPPAAPACRPLSCRFGLGSQRQQLPVDGLAAFPLLELDGPYPMSHPTKPARHSVERPEECFTRLIPLSQVRLDVGGGLPRPMMSRLVSGLRFATRLSNVWNEICHKGGGCGDRKNGCDGARASRRTHGDDHRDVADSLSQPQRRITVLQASRCAAGNRCLL